MVVKADVCPRCGSEDLVREFDKSFEDHGELWIPAECKGCGLEYNAVYSYKGGFDPEADDYVAMEGDYLIDEESFLLEVAG